MTPKAVARPVRRKLPNRRRSWTQKAVIGGQTIYLTCGEYRDGSLGEVFIDAAKAGSAIRAMLNALAMYLSIGIQHGIDLRLYLDVIRGFPFEPSGPVEGSLEVSEAESLLDFIAKQLEAAYLNGKEEGDA